MPFWNKEPKNVFDWETGLGDVTTWKEDWVLDTLKQVDLLGSAKQELTDLHMRRDWKGLDAASKRMTTLAPDNKKFQTFYPAYLEYTELIKAREKQSKENIKKAYGGKVQKFQTGGVAGLHSEPIQTMEQQAGTTTTAPELPSGTSVTFDPLTGTTDETLATTLAPTTALHLLLQQHRVHKQYQHQHLLQLEQQHKFLSLVLGH